MGPRPLRDFVFDCQLSVCGLEFVQAPMFDSQSVDEQLITIAGLVQTFDFVGNILIL